MEPEDFLTFADQVLALSTPASFHASISRSYYAAYNLIFQCIDRIKPLPARKDTHQLILRILKETRVQTLLTIHAKLKDLKEAREDADYLNHGVIFNVEDARIRLHYSQWIFKNRNEFELAKNAIIKTMEKIPECK